jgi:hypothetical protein
MVSEEFLRPATNLVNGAVVLKDFTHGAAIADPRKFSAPEELAILTDSPTSASSFANEGVKMAFAIRAAARAEADGAETSAGHSEVEEAGTGIL